MLRSELKDPQEAEKLEENNTLATVSSSTSQVLSRRRLFLTRDSNSELVINPQPQNSLMRFISSSCNERLSNNRPSAPGFFAPWTTKIANYADLYNLLISSPLNNGTKKITRYKEISEDNILDSELDKIKDDQQFQIGFTRKYCVLSIWHASLAFRDPETGNFLIVGRQNEQFLKSDPYSSPSFWSWIVSSINPKTIWNFTTTKMDNEKHYNFFPGNRFSAEITDVIVSGAEVKALIKAVNETICSQKYDVIHSNCYSSVFYGLTQAIKLIAAKEDDQEYRITHDKEIKRIFTLLCSALQDNYQLGLGSLDNAIIMEAILDAMKILEARKLLKITSQTSSVGVSRFEV